MIEDEFPIGIPKSMHFNTHLYEAVHGKEKKTFKMNLRSLSVTYFMVDPIFFFFGKRALNLSRLMTMDDLICLFYICCN